MLIKVCGLKKADQIRSFDENENIDFIGFIFYSKSKRYVDQSSVATKKTKRVGVFVNEAIEEIIIIVKQYQLDFIQLHGDEDVIFCRKLLNQLQNSENNLQNVHLIKAFGIDETFDFRQVTPYESLVDYFLFDTKTANYGGSGRMFDWRTLSNYRGNIPFILSGGIHAEMSEEILKIEHPQFAGIDINSGFEVEPGIKDSEKVKRFVSEIKFIGHVSR